jgi:hypothetical protein
MMDMEETKRGEEYEKLKGYKNRKMNLMNT